MKLLVLSDTHGYLGNADNVLKSIQGKLNGVIHLGDHDDDALLLKKKYSALSFYFVRGNNDYNAKTPAQQMVTLCGRKLLLTHGHTHRVYFSYEPICYWAKEQEADAVLFGHTHSPLSTDWEGLMVFNPGSISLPRGSKTPTFGILDISENGVMTGTIMEYLGKNSFQRYQR